MVGMAIAVVSTIALVFKLADIAGQSALTGLTWIFAGLVAGGGLGTAMARRVEMTKMPELVAFMHSMIGLAAVFIAVAAVAEPWAHTSLWVDCPLLPRIYVFAKAGSKSCCRPALVLTAHPADLLGGAVGV
jgi:NAD/NADP transhydrogenase beta subunit